MQIRESTLQSIYSLIEELGYVKKLTDLSYFFHDEPKIYSYSLTLKGIPEAKRLSSRMLGGAGISFFSRKLALLKTLMEAVERVSAAVIDPSRSVKGPPRLLEAPAVDPRIYNPAIPATAEFNWIKGRELTRNTDAYIPTQLLHLVYPYPDPKEPVLDIPNTSGEAAGFDRESATLRGLYELIERDALMTTHLLSHKAPLIDLRQGDSRLRRILDILDRYRLSVKVFDITNDLQIPSFLAILLDDTGIGLPVTFGYRSNLDVKKAIIGSIEETFLGRSGIRAIAYNKEKFQHSLLVGNRHDTVLDRIAYLTGQLPASPASCQTRNKASELDAVRAKMSAAGLPVYVADITYPAFEKAGIRVMKAVVPGLQPYLFNHQVILRRKRLEKASQFFGQASCIINPVPHPFDEKYQ